MVTVRQLAACLGVATPALSVRALFGGTPPPLSLLTLVTKAMQRTVDPNLIHVVTHMGDGLLVGNLLEINAAIDAARFTFAAVDLGIGRVHHWEISGEDAVGFVNIDGHDEASLLTELWDVPGTAVNVFLVQTYAGPTVGRSPITGPCEAEKGSGSGLVVALEHAPSITANTLAHELGHYLGLWHVADPGNLMFKNVPNGGGLTAEQGKKMKSYCKVYTGCRPG
jgi:hypothetical protein